MKTKLILILLTLSIFNFAQKAEKTVTSTMQTFSRLDYTSYFEVTREMFKMLSESNEASTEFKEYIGKLHTLKLVQATGESRQAHGIQLYQAFLEKTDLNDYSRLMTKKEGDSNLSFYKKTSKSENEFLLVSTDMIIYITGTIDLKSIGEFEQIMEIAGSAFDF